MDKNAKQQTFLLELQYLHVAFESLFQIEAKENERQGRPLGSKRKGKINFKNVTPRKMTKLPLRTTQTNGQ